MCSVFSSLKKSCNHFQVIFSSFIQQRIILVAITNKKETNKGAKKNVLFNLIVNKFELKN